MKNLPYTLLGLNFAVFADFDLIRENPRNLIHKEISIASIREIKSPQNFWNKKVICEIFPKTGEIYQLAYFLKEGAKF